MAPLFTPFCDGRVAEAIINGGACKSIPQQVRARGEVTADRHCEGRRPAAIQRLATTRWVDADASGYRPTLVARFLSFDLHRQLGDDRGELRALLRIERAKGAVEQLQP